MDRDALLTAALGAAVLTGCTPGRRDAAPPPESPSPSASPTVGPDVAVVVEWADAENALAFRYATLVKSVPALAPLRANHLARAEAVSEHLARLGGTPSPAAVLHRKLPLPALVRSLTEAEREHATRVLARLSRLRDPDLVALGAELAAGARQHAVLLGLVPLPKAGS